MQLKFRFFEGTVIEYIISKKTRFCCVYEKTCYGTIAYMLFLNMLYNHGKLCACIIKCTIALSLYTNRLDYMICSIDNSLTSNHAEADTRMICHAKDASLTHFKVIINSPDTDVFFTVLNPAVDVNAQIYFKTGVQTKRRIISLDKVKEEFNPQSCSALLKFHGFTGKTMS